ncbi:hypothetical protein CTI12_AA438040 [Artemisia annua]|uniref:DUF7950 domain-containing protein n=1 Tax=Artemisia annua TaxID=35608 RepID=A0A2U1LZ12_ARTAN|nr:hypothetical protein CTI12_AA438040 [Artemisia annua]
MTSGNKRVESPRAGGGMKNEVIMNQIMLKFRPIAPRPTVVESSVPPVKVKRAKRNNVRVKKKMKINDSKNLTNFDMVDVSNGSSEIGLRRVIDPIRNVPDWINFDVNGRSMNEINLVSGFNQIKPAHASVDLHETNLLTTMNPRHVVESWITIESVTGTCDDVKLLPDEKLVKDLEVDTCPGFVSNGYDKVEWVNLAYRRMVDPNYRDGEVPQQDVVVWLGTIVEKEKVKNWPAFSSRVRVVYQLPEKKRVSVTVPCDVWKMDSGGYAWRLDVKAALSLGRLNY